jgi:hypothetical protein
MGLFNRKARPTVAASAPAAPMGRHLHSDASEATCIEHLLSLLGSPPQPRVALRWTGDPAKEPTAVVGVRLEGGVAQLAIWSGGGYQESKGYQEMALVVPGFDPDVPLSVIGRWKSLDPSLKSIGWSRDLSIVADERG